MKLSSEMNEQPPSGWLTMRNNGELMGLESVVVVERSIYYGFSTENELGKVATTTTIP